jgi:hypothetical protein
MELSFSDRVWNNEGRQEAARLPSAESPGGIYMAGKDECTQQTAPGGTSEVNEVAGALPVSQTQSTPTKDNSQPNMQTGQPSEDPRKAVGMLERSIQQRIGSILRDSFTDIEQEPLPERLAKLMEALRAQEKRR